MPWMPRERPRVGGEGRGVTPDYTPIPTQVLVALAQLLMRKARRQFAVDTREQAIMIIRSLRPAISRSVPLCAVIPTAVHKKHLSLSVDSVKARSTSGSRYAPRGTGM